MLLFAGTILVLVISGYVAWRHRDKDKIARGFTTSQHVHVKLSPATVFLTVDEIDQWVEDLCNLWQVQKGWDYWDSRYILRNTVAIFKDQVFVDMVGQTVYGACYFDTRICEMATISWGKSSAQVAPWVKFLLDHELSHLIAFYVGGITECDEAHRLFEEVGIKWADFTTNE